MAIIARIDHSNDEEREQSLKEHSENVTEIIKYYVEGLGIENTVCLIGMLHDMGKANMDFYHHMLKETNNYIDGDHVSAVDHAHVGAKYLFENESNSNLLYNAYLQIIGMSIMCHHTGLKDFLSYDGTSPYLKRISKEEPYFKESVEAYTSEILCKEEIHSTLLNGFKEFEAIQKELLDRYKNFSKSEMQYLEMSLLGRLLFSCLLDADQTDASNFTNYKEFTKRSPPGWTYYYQNLLHFLSQFSHATEIDRMRAQVSESCDDFGIQPQGIYQLIVPTGGGKTLASLRFALKHAIVHENIRHIYYVIPYIAILKQNACSIKKVLFQNERVSEEKFLEHYGTFIAEDKEQYLKYTQRWDSDITLTTMVQFMNALYNGKKQDAKRMHQLSNSIIIFDEVQSLPPHLMHLFTTACNFLHNVMHSTIILCSATQPHFHKVSKPLVLTSVKSMMVPHYKDLYMLIKRITFHNKYKKGGYTLEEISDFILECLNEESSALVVMNTKRQAETIYQNLVQQVPSDIYLFYLSTNLCIEHRERILDKIRELLSQDKRVVCISTNMIEAGVDISFPMVLRAMAGLDNLLQCAGRCNRNGELLNRLGSVYMLNVRDESYVHLKDLGKRVDSMLKLLNEYADHPEALDNDLLSLKSIDLYYQYYLTEYACQCNKDSNHNGSKNEFDYPLKHRNGTLYDLLSVNKKGREAEIQSKFAFPLKFAYEDAGREFKVIDENTIAVIVPFVIEDKVNGEKDGADIIRDLHNGNLNPEYVRSLLSKAQRFSVNLSYDKVIKLHDAFDVLEDYGVYMLNDAYYDENLGVMMEGVFLGEFV